MGNVAGEAPAIPGFRLKRLAIDNKFQPAGDQVTGLLVRMTVLWDPATLCDPEFTEMGLFTMYQGLQSNAFCQQLISCIIFTVKHRISYLLSMGYRFLIARYSLLHAPCSLLRFLLSGSR
jgi:hypothetical protein